MRVVDRSAHGCHQACDRKLLSMGSGFVGRAVAGHRPKFVLTNRFFEAASCDQLHGEIVMSLMNTDLENRNDIWMIELGSSFRFNLEPLHDRWRCEFAGFNHLERHEATEAELPGFIHDAHAAAANLLYEFVVSEITNLRSGSGIFG